MIKAFQKKLPNITLLFVFILYIHNLSRSVYGGDVGDFISAAVVGGIPHPSGYPLITLLGFLLTRINFITPAFMVNLISAVSAALGVYVFYKFSLTVSKNKFIALISSLTLAFNYLYWFFAEIAEVFALNNLFVIILFYLGYLFYTTKKTKYFYLIAFFTGLSMTNNYIVSFIFPALLILLVTNIKYFFKNPRVVLKATLLSFFGFSPVLYILIAGHFNPVINWDNVHDFKSFIDVVLRKHYGTFGVGEFPDLTIGEKIIIQKNYFFYLLNQLTIPVIVISLLGALSLLKKQKLFLICLFLSFVLSGPFFINLIGIPFVNFFHVGIYERFFSMSSVILMFLFPFGIKFIIDLLNNLFAKKTYQNLFLIVFLIIPLILLKYNFPKTDLHNVWLGDKLAYDILTPLPKNAYVLITGDTPLFNTWYVQFALKYRTDVKQLNFVGTNTFEKEKEKFVKKYPKTKFKDDFFIYILQDLAKTHDVFSVFPYQFKKGEKINWVPYGLVYKIDNSGNKLTKEEFLKQQENIWKKFLGIHDLRSNSLSEKSLTISEIPLVYSNSYISLGNYIFEKYKDKDIALSYMNKAVEINPNNANAYMVLATYLVEANKCSLAEKNLNIGKNISPLENKFYFLMYYNYKYCYKNNSKAEEVIKEYSQVFMGDFYKDLRLKK